MQEYLKVASTNLSEMVQDESLQKRIEDAIQLVVNSISAGGNLLVCGNGGSASDAMHITGELVGKFNFERPAINAVCLNSNSTVITAWANDISYETVFARQVEAHQGVNSVLWGLSTSGNSVNVLRAFERAGELGMQRILMTGRRGGSINNHSEIVIDVPAEGAPHIQELHIIVYHYMCAEIEERLMNKAV